MSRVTRRWRVRQMTASGVVRERADHLAGEEPLEIRIGGVSFTVTMRTPGDDFDLVAGFLVSEGVVRGGHEIARMDYRGAVGPTGERDYNVVDVRLAGGSPRRTPRCSATSTRPAAAGCAAPPPSRP